MVLCWRLFSQKYTRALFQRGTEML
jgi:hypothetical protein